MASEKIDRLIVRLRQVTEASRITWEAGSRADQLIWSSPNGSVVLESVDGDGLPPYRINVLDAEGRTTDAVQEGGQGRLADLYDRARRLAFNLDATVDGLLAELDRRDPPPPF
jgi:hypothetical protein